MGGSISGRTPPSAQRAIVQKPQSGTAAQEVEARDRPPRQGTAGQMPSADASNHPPKDLAFPFSSRRAVQAVSRTTAAAPSPRRASLPTPFGNGAPGNAPKDLTTNMSAPMAPVNPNDSVQQLGKRVPKRPVADVAPSAQDPPSSPSLSFAKRPKLEVASDCAAAPHSAPRLPADNAPCNERPLDRPVAGAVMAAPDAAPDPSTTKISGNGTASHRDASADELTLQRGWALLGQPGMTVLTEATSVQQVCSVLKQLPCFAFALDLGGQRNPEQHSGGTAASNLVVPNPNGKRSRGDAAAAGSEAPAPVASATHVLATSAIEGVAFSVSQQLPKHSVPANPMPPSHQRGEAAAEGAGADPQQPLQRPGNQHHAHLQGGSEAEVPRGTYQSAVYVPLKDCTLAAWLAVKAALESRSAMKVTFNLKPQLAALQAVGRSPSNSHPSNGQNPPPLQPGLPQQQNNQARLAIAQAVAGRQGLQSGQLPAEGDAWPAIRPAQPVLDVRVAVWVANPDADNKSVPNIQEGPSPGNMNR